MKKIYYFLMTGLMLTSGFVFSSFSSSDKVVSTDRVTQLIADWERAKVFTKEYLDAMPAEGYNFKASEDIRSFAQQMLHLAQGNIGITSTSTGKERLYAGKQLEKMEEYQNKEAVDKIVMESYDFVIAALKDLDDQKLQEKVKFFNGQEYTREVGIGKAFEHQTHHRGQTTIYLRLKGVTPPAEKLF